MAKTTEQIYDELISIPDYGKLFPDEAIDALGLLIDYSGDLSKAEGLHHAIRQAQLLLSKNLSKLHKTKIYYFLGNAWTNLRTLKHRKDKLAWEWEQPEVENEILYFRLFNKFVNEKSEIEKPYFWQANTNLGNSLNHVGRFVEAIEYWDKVLQGNPMFRMALANKGYGIKFYAESLYDEGHIGVFLQFVYKLLKNGLQTKEIHLSARKQFEQTCIDLEKRVGKKFLEEPFDMDNFSLGKTKGEKYYRKWCLNNRLFINPLNDLGSYNIAAQDVFTCPSIHTSKEETFSYYPPSYFGFFNQLKQEYVSARYLFYESTQNEKAHYSDRNVLIYNMLNYSCYSLNTEKLKIAFRMLYSLFDKIAYFINEYLKLNIPETKVTIRTLWYKNQRKTDGLREEFVSFKNWPLRGLFWLTKDLLGNGSDFYEVIEPDAKDLVKIRNYLEHKYITITLYPITTEDEAENKSNDKTYTVWREDFVLKTFRLMKLVRAAMIYLSLGIHIEERIKSSIQKGIVGTMVLDTWEDDWKF